MWSYATWIWNETTLPPEQDGGFLKWGYPQIIHFNKVFPYNPTQSSSILMLGFPIKKKQNPAIGVLPWLWNPPDQPCFPTGKQLGFATFTHTIPTVPTIRPTLPTWICNFLQNFETPYITIYSPYTHPIFTIYHHIFTIYSPYIHHISPYIHHILTIINHIWLWNPPCSELEPPRSPPYAPFGSAVAITQPEARRSTPLNTQPFCWVEHRVWVITYWSSNINIYYPCRMNIYIYIRMYIYIYKYVCIYIYTRRFPESWGTPSHPLSIGIFHDINYLFMGFPPFMTPIYDQDIISWDFIYFIIKNDLESGCMAIKLAGSSQKSLGMMTGVSPMTKRKPPYPMMHYWSLMRMSHIAWVYQCRRYMSKPINWYGYILRTATGRVPQHANILAERMQAMIFYGLMKSRSCRLQAVSTIVFVGYLDEHTTQIRVASILT